MLAICSLMLSLWSADVRAAEPVESMVILHPSIRETVPWLPDAARQAATGGRWEELDKALAALDTSGYTPGQLGDVAFLRTLAAVRQDKPEAARAHLPAMAQATTAPSSYAQWLRAEVSEPSDQVADEALAYPKESVYFSQLLLQRGAMLESMGATDRARETYRSIVGRDEQSSSVASALLRLAALTEGEERNGLYRRAWTEYPRDAVAADVVAGLQRESAPPPTWEQRSVRAEKLMALGEFRSAQAEADRALKGINDTKSEDACRVIYVRGRSMYKTNQLSNAIAAFDGAALRCKGVSAHYGASSAYLKGMAEFRTRRYTNAAASFQEIVANFPEHSMADDGLTKAGIAFVEADNLAGAQKVWSKAITDYPQGDTSAEAAWRLAWSHYQGGNTEKAIAVADKLAASPVVNDWIHVAGGHYWAARWRMYPNLANPQAKTADPLRQAEALKRWKALCELYPDSFYAILAFARLVEIAPESAMTFDFNRVPFHQVAKPENWVVRLSTYENAAFREGVGLARLGLIREARQSWDRLDSKALTGDEMALMIELRIANGDWLYAHNAFRQYLKVNPPVRMGGRLPSIVRVAYPDRYWKEVQVAAKGDTMEPRFFHALVREESNFNRRIVSFAGAIGLSQLMPKTAEQTAGWLKMGITSASLREAAPNLKIGAYYLDRVLKQLDGNPYLALAGYNAGPGRVNQWKGKWGNLPTDEYIESIPYKETREYVKRVMGTWQLMRWHFDGGEPFVNLSRFNHHVAPSDVEE
jgi:soluble lytic murein transglycosylase